ncbi:MAG: alpha/beta hydrolase [Actinomycetota bacterium]
MSDLAMSEIKVRGVATDLYEIGAGRPILFLHSGEGLRPDVPYLAALAKHGKVIAPVHPGFGRQEVPRAYSTVDDLAYFYLDLLDHLNLHDVVMIGADFGGWIATEVAVRSTERLSALVLAGSVGVKMGDRTEREIADLWTLSREPLIDLMYADHARAESGMSPLRATFGGLSDEELTIIARARESLALFGWKPYLHNPHLHNWLHRIDVPSLVVWGDRDRFTAPDYGRRLSNAIPGARFVEIPGVGHFPHIEAPEVFAQTVAEFLQSIPVSAASASRSKP